MKGSTKSIKILVHLIQVKKVKIVMKMLLKWNMELKKLKCDIRNEIN